jgi:hypothetical protein
MSSSAHLPIIALVGPHCRAVMLTWNADMCIVHGVGVQQERLRPVLVFNGQRHKVLPTLQLRS